MKNVLRVALVAALASSALFATGCTSKPQAGEIGVVRNGGLLDNHNIRQVVPNGAGNTWVGWFSESHYYPVDSQQRYFRFATCYDKDRKPVVCDNADALAITVQTEDGKDVTIEGTFYLNTVFNNSKAGERAVQAFDTQFSTRTFGSDGLHAYEGNAGWSDFLGAIVEPIVVNNLRDTISGVRCADLVSSCALVQTNTSAADAKKPPPSDVTTGKNNQSNIARVQSAVQTGLGTDLVATIGGRTRQAYFANIKFTLARVLLPGKVQAAINDAQSAFAAVSQAQARIQSATADALANEERQNGYNKCPACQEIDKLKALPAGLQALGGNIAVGIGGK